MAERETESEALRAMLKERSRGPFIGVSEGRKRTLAMLERKKRAAEGLPRLLPRLLGEAPRP